MTSSINSSRWSSNLKRFSTWSKGLAGRLEISTNICKRKDTHQFTIRELGSPLKVSWVGNSFKNIGMLCLMNMLKQFIKKDKKIYLPIRRLINDLTKNRRKHVELWIFSFSKPLWNIFISNTQKNPNKRKSPLWWIEIKILKCVNYIKHSWHNSSISPIWEMSIKLCTFYLSCLKMMWFFFRIWAKRDISYSKTTFISSFTLNIIGHQTVRYRSRRT